jgi:N-acyl-D-amino-acid deacylase
MTDLAIINGTIVDGTNAAPRRGHLRISNGTITAIDDADAVHGNDVVATTVIDARGKMVCPGFIDIHTHSDLTLIADGRGESKLRQGVTTEVVGNCSFSAFPIEPMHLDLHADHLARATAPVRPWWTDLDGYADALHNEGIALNVAPLAGHGTLRVAAMGVDQRPPTTSELRRMVSDLHRALEQGAFGMSTGLTHVPSAYGDFDEILALAAVLAEHRALYATHSRAAEPDERAAVVESIEVGRRTGVSVEFSHLAINRPDRWGTGSELLALFDQARTEGIDIFFDVYPYEASSSSLTQYLPPWVQAGGTDAMRSRLADRTTRDRALADMADGWFNGIPWLWDRFHISSTPDGNYVGLTLEAAAARTNVAPDELTLRLCEEYGNEIQVVLFYRTEADVSAFLQHPLAVVGSDGNAIPLHQPSATPHPRNFGTFPRILGRYVRERGVLEIADAVRKMTAEPARRLGINDRGSLVVGKAADVVVFDPSVVLDRADFGKQPERPDGITHVVVNGSVVLRDGDILDTRPGRVLRHAS